MGIFSFLCKSKNNLASSPITTNPPARAIALAKRKEYRDKTVKKHYERLIESINNAINRGDLSYDHYFSCCTSYKPYSKDEAYIYLAARQLRANGFKVRIQKRTAYPQPAYRNEYGMVPETTNYSKCIKISW